MSGDNYRYVREHLYLDSFDIDTNTTTTRDPTNAEILRLLDALHADITGVNTKEYDQALMRGIRFAQAIRSVRLEDS